MKIKILHLYPQLLNLYGDKGNIEALRKRLIWRGFDVEVVCHNIKDDKLSLEDVDIIFLGGGGDREERVALSDLMQYKSDIEEYVNGDGVLLAVCGGFPMLGKYYMQKDEKVEGLGILDMYTEYGEKNLVGDVIIDSPIIGSKIVGFENHKSYTYIGDLQPLGRVISGNGNNPTDRAEGVIYKNVCGTYLHGPILPKNPRLCDYILANAIKGKGLDFEGISSLNDEDEDLSREVIIKRYQQ